MKGERRYRGKRSRPIPVWNGVIEDRVRIDVALWAFLWLLDAITEERDGTGIVLGGAPVKASRIAKDLAFDERTVREHLQTLEDGHYIKRRRTAYGYVIEVCNSRKFGIWQAHKRSEQNTRSQGKRSEEIPGQTGRKGPIRSGKKRINKEDAAVTQQKDAAAATPPTCEANPQDSVWTFLKISPCGPFDFRALLQSRWSSRNGQPCSIVIGDVVDAWELAERQKLPRAGTLFQALKKLREQERSFHPLPASGEPIHIIKPEEMPA
jgi:hypothetical protein